MTGERYGFAAFPCLEALRLRCSDERRRSVGVSDALRSFGLVLGLSDRRMACSAKVGEAVSDIKRRTLGRSVDNLADDAMTLPSSLVDERVCRVIEGSVCGH